jgi:hypothetical protein
VCVFTVGHTNEPQLMQNCFGKLAAPPAVVVLPQPAAVQLDLLALVWLGSNIQQVSPSLPPSLSILLSPGFVCCLFGLSFFALERIATSFLTPPDLLAAVGRLSTSAEPCLLLRLADLSGHTARLRPGQSSTGGRHPDQPLPSRHQYHLTPTAR